MPVVEWCVSGTKDLRFVGRTEGSREPACMKVDI